MYEIKEVLKEGVAKLSAKNIGNPSLDARILLEHVTKMSRTDIIVKGDLTITVDLLNEYSSLLERRLLGEPISHIVGNREFWGLNFKVNRNVLDPRPDSETLVEAALSLVLKNVNISILDLGTGSGCLALSLLSELPKASAVLVDLSDKALEVAKENALNLGLYSRTEFVQSNWAMGLKNRQYDLIVSNPPYIPEGDISGLAVEVREFEPISALVGGKSGLDCYRDLAPQIASFLKVGGYALLEFGIGQGDDIKAIFEKVDLSFVCFKKDLTSRDRVIVLTK